MASEQVSQNEFITQAVAEAARVAIQTIAMANTSRQENKGPRMSGSILKQPMFSWNAKDKYEELLNFKLEVSNVLQNYNLGQTEKVSIIKSWLGRESLKLIETLTQDEQEACHNEKALFETLNRKGKPQYNKTIKLCKYAN